MDYESGLRPEYVAAVDAAVNHWLGWLTLVLPAVVVSGVGILAAVKRRRRWLLLAVGYLIGVSLFAPLSIGHIYFIQQAKERNLKTRAEQDDWASDVGVTFAPFLQPVVGAIYCGVFSAPWLIVAAVSSSKGTNRSDAEFMQ